jgi:hypothetical protein
MPRPLLCPICKSAVQELDRTGDATGYACATHGNFKVTDTVFAEQRAKDYTREQWEAQGKAENEAAPMARYKQQRFLSTGYPRWARRAIWLVAVKHLQRFRSEE